VRDAYTIAWLLWVLGFVVTEAKAILDDDEDPGNYTLSHYVRRLAVRSRLFRYGLLALLGWLPFHFELLEGLF
jgi:hypothetical protein